MIHRNNIKIFTNLPICIEKGNSTDYFSKPEMSSNPYYQHCYADIPHWPGRVEKSQVGGKGKGRRGILRWWVPLSPSWSYCQALPPPGQQPAHPLTPQRDASPIFPEPSFPTVLVIAFLHLWGTIFSFGPYSSQEGYNKGRGRRG